MTWILKRRPNPGSRIVAYYECPDCGIFAATVERDGAGDPPDEMPCPADVLTWAGCTGEPFTEYCGLTSPWRPSAVRGHVKAGEVVRGKVAEYPGEQYVMSTQALADGMPYDEWRARRRKVEQNIVINKMRNMTGRA